MAGVVGVPDPDATSVLHNTGTGLRGDPDRVERSRRNLDLLLSFDVDRDIECLVAVVEREQICVADVQALRGDIEHGGENVSDAVGYVELDMLHLRVLQVRFVEDGFLSRVVEVDKRLSLMETFFR